MHISSPFWYHNENVAMKTATPSDTNIPWVARLTAPELTTVGVAVVLVFGLAAAVVFFGLGLVGAGAGAGDGGFATKRSRGRRTLST